MRLIEVLTVPFLVAAAATAHAADPVLYSCGFEDESWKERLNGLDRGNLIETVAADPSRRFESLRGRALRIKVAKGGHYGGSLQYRFMREHGREPEEIYFRYYLRLADDWDPARGGKLPGIAGTYNRAGWGGRPVHGDDGWSARGLFRGRKDGRTPVGYYCYHMDMRGRYGSDWLWDRDGLGLLENNRWYCIEQRVKLNTPGKADGVMQAWVDGKLAFEKTDVRLRSVNRLKIECVWINVYLGGSWTSRRDQHLYIDDVVISSDRIGEKER